MIQRIQSLYLVGALILIILCYFLPVADIVSASSQIYVFNLTGFKVNEHDNVYKIESASSLFWAGIFLCLILIAAIFLFKRRILQIRLCVYGIVISIGMTLMFLFVLHNLNKNLGTKIYYHISLLFPLISGILSYMALRAIKKDEDLVKSYDRLR